MITTFYFPGRIMNYNPNIINYTDNDLYEINMIVGSRYYCGFSALRKNIDWFCVPVELRRNGVTI